MVLPLKQPKHMFNWKNFNPKLLDVLHFGNGSIFVELERWIQKIRLVFNNSTRRTEFLKWQTGEFIYHLICCVEYSSLCSSFISFKGSFEIADTPKKTKKESLAQSTQIGPCSVLVHRFWRSWKKNSIADHWRVDRVLGVNLLLKRKKKQTKLLN